MLLLCCAVCDMVLCASPGFHTNCVQTLVEENHHIVAFHFFLVNAQLLVYSKAKDYHFSDPNHVIASPTNELS